MNKTALKNFATNARKELIEKVKAKAFRIGITEESIKKAQFESSDAIYIDGKQLSATEKKQREKLISRIKEIGYKQVVEEVAYTWFNRFTALRFMEVNSYLPTKVRVLSSSNSDSSEPDIIKEALTVDLDIDKELVYELKLNNKTEELYKYLLIKQCNSLNKVLPFMFETIEDYKEILFPDGLLVKDSFLREMTDKQIIPEIEWKHVEIIGWLYQYYIADEKDRVIKAKKKYKTEEIPFATQLFTPDWIVRYMVQNTLGRYWIESHSEHRDLVRGWDFYLENPQTELNIDQKLVPYINKEMKVEDIKCFDPAMGSGHILVYLFDVLYEIYIRCGYTEREIPRLIIENNLYGVDIDERAYQLACFSVVMKALQYNNRFLRSITSSGLKLNLACIIETNEINEQDLVFIAGATSGIKYERIKEFIQTYRSAKTFGSLIKIEEYDKEFLQSRIEELKSNPVQDVFLEESRQKAIEILPLLIRQSDLLIETYDVLITNPPYLSTKYMNNLLVDFVNCNYNEVKYDLFSAFIVHGFNKVKKTGHLGVMCPFVWMFISSYENLRKRIINEKNISSLIQLEYSAFEEATVPICTFTLRNDSIGLEGEYVDLSAFTGGANQPIKVREAISDPKIGYRYSFNQMELKKIPTSPIAYWSTQRVLDIFENSKKLGEISEPRQGMATSDNNRFLRLWSEVDFRRIGFNYKSLEHARESKLKWFPYNKGGDFRKWYGNNDFIVNWENDGHEVKEYAAELYKSYTRTIKNIPYYFKQGITYTFISSSKFGVRYSPAGFIFDVAGSTIFPKEEDILYITAFLCSNLAHEFLKIQNPTLNFQVGNIKNLPLMIDVDDDLRERINNLAEQNIQLSKADWDSYENSWDFKRHPLLNYKKSKIEEAYIEWEGTTNERFNSLKLNEEELNKLFIEIYKIQNEYHYQVLEDDVTVRRADRGKDIKSLLSYGVGCILGRYSLDQEGLVYAGGKFELENNKLTLVDRDNIIPILSDPYLEDDLVAKLIEFIAIAFGKEALTVNLEYIAGSLDKREGETPKETIRRYLRDDFYKDHLQLYKKKPIYWLFTSGKQKAFNCLIYMHRYDKSTLSRIRTDYLHELQIRMDAEKKTLLDIINGDGTTKEISNAKKELKFLDLKIEELRAYDEKLHHMADMQIEIDLDDGVAVNYAKFEGLLAPIK